MPSASSGCRKRSNVRGSTPPSGEGGAPPPSSHGRTTCAYAGAPRCSSYGRSLEVSVKDVSGTAFVGTQETVPPSPRSREPCHGRRRSNGQIRSKEVDV